LHRYIAGTTGLLAGISQYLYLFILGTNPALFKLFKPKHYVIFTIGLTAALFNHRAILPFVLICLMDLDYSKLTSKTKKWLLFFFGLGLSIILVFGDW